MNKRLGEIGRTHGKMMLPDVDYWIIIKVAKLQQMTNVHSLDSIRQAVFDFEWKGIIVTFERATLRIKFEQ